MLAAVGAAMRLSLLLSANNVHLCLIQFAKQYSESRTLPVIFYGRSSNSI
jgi:hypothetical protein